MTTPLGGWGNPVFGGGALREPAIMSPNFDIANPSASPSPSWGILQNGLAYFFGLTITGGTIVGPDYIINTAGAFFYSGTPAAGNLIVSITNTGGTDTFGNPVLARVASYNGFANGDLATVQSPNGLVFYEMVAGAWVEQSVLFWNLADQTIHIESPISIDVGDTTTSTIGSNLKIDGIFFCQPSLDNTGVTDYNAISAALAAGYSVQLGMGTYYLSQPLTWSNAELVGLGDGTIIQPGGSWSGASLLEPGSNAMVANLQGYGGSSTRSGNPAANLVQVGSTATFWKVENVTSNYINGYVVLCFPVNGSHGTITTIKGEHNAGGIRIDNGTAVNVDAEINIFNVDLQNCETNEIIYLSDVTDVLGTIINGSILTGAAVSGITIHGTCQTCGFDHIDIGGGTGTGLVVFSANATGSPTECRVGPGTVQKGNVGVVVNGASARIWLDRLMAKNMQTDGFQWNTTGAFNRMSGCGGNLNNQSAGVGYDVNVTVVGHLLNDGFSYVSGTVTDGRFLVAGNHYTEANPPASMTSAGAVPGGW